MSVLPIGRLDLILLDCLEPGPLADFWCGVLGMHRSDEDPEGRFVDITDGRTSLSMVRVEAYEPPTWPGPGQQQQLHLDVAVDDLDVAQEAAVAIGARVAAVQPNDHCRVLLDPAGHPFCLVDRSGS